MSYYWLYFIKLVLHIMYAFHFIIYNMYWSTLQENIIKEE